MLQETTAPAAGAGNAQALTQMGFANLIEHMTVVNWIVFIVLILMSVLSVYWIIYNFIKHIRLKGSTVGATAPFVGLLGTVWGIYNALIRIGATGQADIGAVAGPVGEALIMTAIGLGVAIPAVLGYNFFVRLNRGVNAKLDTFAHDLHDFFATGARVGEAR